MKTKFKYLSWLYVAILFSCDSDDCNLNVYPELNMVQLQNANIGEAYFETISAEIINEENDDGFDYYFTVRGNVPSGINFEQNNRELNITGVPSVVGNFSFKVELLVALRQNEDNSDSPLCDDFISRTFTLHVQ